MPSIYSKPCRCNKFVRKGVLIDTCYLRCSRHNIGERAYGSVWTRSWGFAQLRQIPAENKPYHQLINPSTAKPLSRVGFQLFGRGNRGTEPE